MLEELSQKKKELEKLLDNEFLKDNPKSHLALQTLEISLSNLSEVTFHLSQAFKAAFRKGCSFFI